MIGKGWEPRALLCMAGMLAAVAARPAVAAEFPVDGDSGTVGAVATYVTAPGDNLLDLARHYDLGYTQLIAANPGVDPWRPGVRRRITIPSFYLLPDAPPRGIVVNLAAHRLFYYPPGSGEVETFPIGEAVLGLDTPLGTTRIIAKTANPAWYPPASIRAERPDLPASIPPGPDNPLGAYALFLGWPNYLIHGTNKPDGVGRNVSHGCLHLYPEDIAHLYREVPIGTPVRVVKQAMAVRWIGDTLFVEIHPSKAQAEALDNGESFTPASPPDLMARVTTVAGDRLDRVDWTEVERAGRERTGIPVPVTLPLAAETVRGGSPR